MRDLIPNLQICTTSKTVLQVSICIFPLLPFSTTSMLFYIPVYTQKLSKYKMRQSTGACCLSV